MKRMLVLLVAMLALASCAQQTARTTAPSCRNAWHRHGVRRADRAQLRTIHRVHKPARKRLCRLADRSAFQAESGSGAGRSLPVIGNFLQSGKLAPAAARSIRPRSGDRSRAVGSEARNGRCDPVFWSGRVRRQRWGTRASIFPVWGFMDAVDWASGKSTVTSLRRGALFCLIGKTLQPIGQAAAINPVRNVQPHHLEGAGAARRHRDRRSRTLRRFERRSANSTPGQNLWTGGPVHAAGSG